MSHDSAMWLMGVYAGIGTAVLAGYAFRWYDAKEPGELRLQLHVLRLEAHCLALKLRNAGLKLLVALACGRGEPQRRDCGANGEPKTDDLNHVDEREVFGRKDQAGRARP